MDWNGAIEKNREALKRVLAMLVAMAGLAGADPGSPSPLRGGVGGWGTLPRHLHRAVLRLLRPAEAAARRLIIVAARGLVVPPPGPPSLRKPKPTLTILRNGVGTGIVMQPGFRPKAGTPAARLCLPPTDPLPLMRGRERPAARGVPRISVPGLTQPFRVPRTPSRDDPIDATRLTLRLAALGRALDDLPHEARRFARWRARGAGAIGAQIKSRDAAGAQNGKTHGAGPFRRVWPLRPGHPPGWRRRPAHEVHDILNVVHGLAFWALERPDTS